MLKKEQKDKLIAMGFDVDAIIAAHADAAEKDIKIPEGQLLTDAQLTARDEVKVKEGKKEGEKEALTIARTELKKHTGLDLKGERFGDIGKEIKDAINADKDTKLTALQEQNTLLLADKTTLSSEVANAQKALKTGMFEIGILSQLPANGLGLTPKETFELLKLRGYLPEETDAGVIWKKGNEPIKDPVTHAPLSADKAIAAIWAEQKLTPAAPPPGGGRGIQQKAVSAGTEGIKTKSQAEAAWIEANPDRNMNTPEGMAYYNKLVKDTPDFDMYS